MSMRAEMMSSSMAGVGGWILDREQDDNGICLASVWKRDRVLFVISHVYSTRKGGVVVVRGAGIPR